MNKSKPSLHLNCIIHFILETHVLFQNRYKSETVVYVFAIYYIYFFNRNERMSACHTRILEYLHILLHVLPLLCALP